MATHKFADLLFLKFPCSAPKCGKPIEKVIREFKGRDNISCPSCGTVVDLKRYKGAIEDAIEFTAELDKKVRE